jgi:hypothetical protein
MRLILLLAIAVLCVGCGKAGQSEQEVLSLAQVMKAFADQGVDLAVDVNSVPFDGDPVVAQILSPRTAKGRAVRAVYVLSDARTALHTARRVPPRTLEQLDSKFIAVKNVLIIVKRRATTQELASVQAAIDELRTGLD